MERYSRNILIEEIGEEGQHKLLNSKVLIAGAGGLGATVIANLASLGIGNIGIIDFDKLELSNLNRQYIHKYKDIGINKANSAKEWVQEYNPDINVEAFSFKLDKNNGGEIIKRFDVVVDCFDSYDSKFLLNELCFENNKILIHGGVTEFFGQVLTVIPRESACLSCMLPEKDPNAYVARGIISPTASTIASIQSMEVVKVILGLEKTLKNRLLTYNGLKQEFRELSIDKNPNCPLCA